LAATIKLKHFPWEFHVAREIPPLQLLKERPDFHSAWVLLRCASLHIPMHSLRCQEVSRTLAHRELVVVNRAAECIDSVADACFVSL
jgi:hypothetical protein